MTSTPTPRIALVTGASRGIGRSAALHLSDAGIAVIGTYRDPATDVAALEREPVEGQAAIVMLPLEVGDSAAYPAFATAVAEALADRFGADRFDYLVNNAGHGLSKPYLETTEDELDELLAVHVKAPYLLTRALLPLIADGGRVLNVSSGLARLTYAGSSAYALAKGAVEVLTRYQAVELGSRGIRVNVVAPGVVATDFRGGFVRDTPGVRESLASTVTLGRVADADDIGAAIPAILSDAMGWMDGIRLELSGGQAV